MAASASVLVERKRSPAAMPTPCRTRRCDEQSPGPRGRPFRNFIDYSGPPRAVHVQSAELKARTSTHQRLPPPTTSVPSEPSAPPTPPSDDAATTHDGEQSAVAGRCGCASSPLDPLGRCRRRHAVPRPALEHPCRHRRPGSCCSLPRARVRAYLIVFHFTLCSGLVLAVCASAVLATRTNKL